MSHRSQSSRSDTRALVLSNAIALFAASGYTGVSMRDIANSLKISASALYHHFPDKQALYLAAVSHAFSGKDDAFLAALNSEGAAEVRLRRFITQFCQLIQNDHDFDRLMHRELLDGDEQRMKLLADHVFKELFIAVCQLVEELSPDLDPHLAAVSIIGLVIYHLECRPLRQFLPAAKAEHDDPDRITEHLMQLLTKGLR